MGYSNRDYAFKSVFNGVGNSATRSILVITIAVYILQFLTIRTVTDRETKIRLPGLPTSTDGESVDDAIEIDLSDVDLQFRRSLAEEWLKLDTRDVLHGQIWRLVTSAFCHDRYSLLHIILNMFCLWRFGPDIEAMYGKREFVWFYLVCAVISSLAFILLDLMMDERNSAVGASGAIMAILALYGRHFPYHRIYIFYFIAVEMRWAIWLFAAWDLHPILLRFSGESMSDGIAHSAHLGGLFFGLLYYHYRWRITRFRFTDLFHSWGQRERRPGREIIPFPSRRSERETSQGRGKEGLRVYSEDPIDVILQKLHAEGYDSLTDDEKRRLVKESERLRSRNDSQ